MTKKKLAVRLVSRSLAVAAVTVAGATFASAQSTWNWLGVGGDLAWNNAANWVGGIPDGPTAVANFANDKVANRLSGTTFTFVNAIQLTNGYSPTLAGINFDSVNPYAIFGTGGITAAATGLTINALQSERVPELFFSNLIGHVINVPLRLVAGSGALIKTGPGIVTSFQNNSQAGGTIVNGGMLIFNTGDTGLGAAFTPVAVNGATLRLSGPAYASTGRTLTTTGTSNVDVTATSAQFASLEGSGVLNVRGGGELRVGLGGSGNGFSGTVNIAAGGTFGVEGSLSNVTTINADGDFNLVDIQNNTPNKLSSSVVVNARSAGIYHFLGGLDNSSDTIDTLNHQVGQLAIHVNAGGQPASIGSTITANNYNRSLPTNTLFLGGQTANRTVVLNGAGPFGAIGGGGAGGSTNISILPWASHSPAGFAVNAGGYIGLGHVTRDTGSGLLRPLTNAEYATGFGAADNNVRISASVAVPGAVTANSLSITNGASGVTTTISGTGTITVSSGSILQHSVSTNATGTVIATASVVQPNIAFPTGVKGFIGTFAELRTTGVISGDSGVVKTGYGTWIPSGISTYTGGTTIDSGVVLINGNLPSGANSLLGNSTDPIVLTAPTYFTQTYPYSLGTSNANVGVGAGLLHAAGVGFTTASPTALNFTVDRNIVVNGPNGLAVMLGSSNGDANVTYNGTLTLDRDVTVSFPGIVAGAGSGTFNGVVSGPGRFNGTAITTTTVFLNASNTFSGGILASGGTWIAGHDNAFGTGEIWSTSGTLTTQANFGATGGGTRTIANNFALRGINMGFVTTASPTNMVITGNFDLNGIIRTISATGSATAELRGPVLSGGMHKTGTGTLILTNNSNTFNSGVVIFAGTLQLGTGGANGHLPITNNNIPVLWNAGVDIRTGATFIHNVSTSRDYGFGNSFIGAGTFVKNAAGTAFLGSSNALTGSVQINDGAVQIGFGNTNSVTGTLFSNTPTGAGSVTVTGTGNLVFARADTFTFPQPITGTGTVIQSGGLTAARTILTADSSLASGARVRVLNGTLQVGTNGTTGTLGSPSLISTASTGTIDFRRAGTLSVPSQITGSGTVVHTGTGTLNLNGTWGFIGDLFALGGGVANVAQPALFIDSSNVLTGSALAANAGSRINLNAHVGLTGAPVLVGAFDTVGGILSGNVSMPPVNLAGGAAKGVLIAALLEVDETPASSGIFAGTLDIGNGAAIFIADDLGYVRRAALSGLTGPGLKSQGFAGDARNAFATVGVRLNAAEVFPEFSTFQGLAIGDDAILAMFTYFGDVNLDGKLDAVDFNAVLNGYTNGLTGWQNGDVNYDGVVNATDWSLFSGAYTFFTGGGTPFGSITDPTGAIPEPAALGLLALAVPALSRRRR
jgi:fibronectin-binding autotransporter adhesin